MVGLEEMEEDGRSLLRDLLDHGCEIITIGLYLRPFFSPLSYETFH
jgi:lipoate synthase